MFLVRISNRLQTVMFNRQLSDLTFAVAAAADELIHWIVILRQKMAKTLQTFARCIIFNMTADYL